MRLIDCFCEMISYTLYFLQDQQKDQVTCEDLQKRYDLLISRSKDMAQKSGLIEKWEQGFFPVCALLDELILVSDWRNKGDWVRQRLQKIFFNTTNAGEEFFQRLENMNDDEAIKDLREIYEFCLALGFKGKYYRISDMGRLDDLKYTNMKKITDNTELKIPEELFSEAYESDDISRKRVRTKWRSVSLFSIFMIIVPAFALVGLYYFYYYKLDQILYGYFE